jgi:hypothetical protein
VLNVILILKICDILFPLGYIYVSLLMLKISFDLLNVNSYLTGMGFYEEHSELQPLAG